MNPRKKGAHRPKKKKTRHRGGAGPEGGPAPRPAAAPPADAPANPRPDGLIKQRPAGGPVLDAFAAIFGMDRDTASEYLDYGRSALEKMQAVPDRPRAGIMDALNRGAYDEVERTAPGLWLFVKFGKTSYNPRDPTIGQLAIPPGPPDKLYNQIIVFTREFRTIDAWAVPRDKTSRIGVFRRYLEGEGAYLAEMTRRLPDGRRWTIKYGTGLGGIKELLPEADVGPLDEFQKGGARYKPGPSARDRHQAGGRTRRPRKGDTQTAALGRIRRIFPEANILPARGPKKNSTHRPQGR